MATSIGPGGIEISFRSTYVVEGDGLQSDLVELKFVGVLLVIGIVIKLQSDLVELKYGSEKFDATTITDFNRTWWN